MSIVSPKMVGKDELLERFPELARLTGRFSFQLEVGRLNHGFARAVEAECFTLGLDCKTFWNRGLFESVVSYRIQGRAIDYLFLLLALERNDVAPDGGAQALLDELLVRILKARASAG